MTKKLSQEEMINRVRELCYENESISTALMYGSFAKDEGDEFSDIEFSIFVNNADYDGFDGDEFVGQIAPRALYFTSRAGQSKVIFENLVRGEFNFKRASELSSIRAIKALMGIPWPAVKVIIDRGGIVPDHLDFLSSEEGVPTRKEKAIKLFQDFLYSMLTGFNILARGERAYALEGLEAVQSPLLRMLRDYKGKLLQSETRPFRRLEKDLSESEYKRYAECTASLLNGGLEQAYWAVWTWGKELLEALARRYEIDDHKALVRSLDLRFASIMDQNRLRHVVS